MHQTHVQQAMTVFPEKSKKKSRRVLRLLKQIKEKVKFFTS